MDRKFEPTITLLKANPHFLNNKNLNEQAFEYWKGLIPINYARTAYNIKIKFNYLVHKKRSWTDKIFFQYPTEMKEYENSDNINFLYSEKGKIVENLFDDNLMKNSKLSIWCSQKDQDRLFVNNPINEDGSPMHPTCLFLDPGGMKNCIEVPFSNIVSVSLTDAECED